MERSLQMDEIQKDIGTMQSRYQDLEVRRKRVLDLEVKTEAGTKARADAIRILEIDMRGVESSIGTLQASYEVEMVKHLAVLSELTSSST